MDETKEEEMETEKMEREKMEENMEGKEIKREEMEEEMKWKEMVNGMRELFGEMQFGASCLMLSSVCVCMHLVSAPQGNGLRDKFVIVLHVVDHKNAIQRHNRQLCSS